VRKSPCQALLGEADGSASVANKTVFSRAVPQDGFDVFPQGALGDGLIMAAMLGMPRSNSVVKTTRTSWPAGVTVHCSEASSKSLSSCSNVITRCTGSTRSRSDQHRIPLRKLTDYSDSTTPFPSRRKVISRTALV
jgi:hypothetical protein